ncbi:DHH family phosphoesterase [Aquibacillus sediminis]|uniref:DHH family phosphoesterase n=1 Tax=Aquibacillus sediminis TaxID=2574734 RepID=UPI001108FC1E|nr:bifunctional oligoribonuclease/PAP phosphatase NrnA [Aquibacillus sediminis]
MNEQLHIINKIKEYQTIIIHRHVRPDPDAYGAQGALAELIRYSFPTKQVYIVGDEDPSLAFLLTMDEIPDDTYQDALVIVCDTANQARIADQRYAMGKELIKIDHHPIVDDYGDCSWVDTNSSSTSEMIYELLVIGQEQGLKCNQRAAELMYSGIVGDTGRFLFPSTTDRTFRVASELVSYGFDRTKLYDQLYNTKLHIARFKGYILQNIEISESGVSTITITKDTLSEFGMTPLETSQLVGVLGDIEGVRVWAFFVEEEDMIRVRMRSNGPVINKVAEKYNGGGHPMASGATIYRWEEKQSVIDDLEAVCR